MPAWTAEDDHALLLAFLDDANYTPSKDSWENIATKLGGNFSTNAIMHRWRKFKKEVSEAKTPVTPVG